MRQRQSRIGHAEHQNVADRDDEQQHEHRGRWSEEEPGRGVPARHAHPASHWVKRSWIFVVLSASHTVSGLIATFAFSG